MAAAGQFEAASVATISWIMEVHTPGQPKQPSYREAYFTLFTECTPGNAICLILDSKSE